MDAIFFPRNDYPNNVEVCAHRLGKKMTHCEATTYMPPLVQSKMLPYVEQKGLRVSGIFKSNYLDSAWNTVYGKSLIANGVIWPDLYFFPIDYYDYSEQSVMAAWNIEQPWFIEQFGRKPNFIDFSQGNLTYKDYLKDYLMSYFGYSPMSSLPQSNTNYGIGVGNPNNIPFNSFYPLNINDRVLDRAMTELNEDYATTIANMATLIDNTLLLPNGGITFDFNHWHDVIEMDYNSDGTPKAGRNDKALNAFKSYIDMLVSKNANDEIYFAGCGEAAAYLAYRSMISKAVMYSPTGFEDSRLVIRLEALNVFSIDTDLLQIPISIKFSTTGTPLAGQTIRCENNLISLGNNQYIVEIPYSEYAGAVIEKVNV